METSDPSGRLTAEDLSDCISDSSHSESQLRAFQNYERIKELNLSIDKTKDDTLTESKDFHLSLEGNDRTPVRFNEFPCENPTRNLTMTLNKAKDFAYSPNNLTEINYSMDRLNENEESADTVTLCRSKNSSGKNVLFNLRETKQRSPHTSLSSLDRYSKDLNFVVEKEIKDFGMLKNYNLDRMKEFNFSLDRMRDNHISSLALERLRGGAGVLENSTMLDHKDFRNLQVQPRNPDLEAIALERMRRSHLLGTELSAQNLSTQVPHPHSITHMQHSQQQQQQQAKSFTIDAILGLRNNQREKRSQQQQYRKHQGQESSTKNGSSSSNSGGGGKVKRVRTIFTAEQLERLEGEFARQQYMVGPERLYLAHALRLTEAQVKVWFQNRRIKWRKLHHEQQSQRVHEFQRTLNSSLEHEDSNEADKCFLMKMEQIGRHKTKNTSPHTSTWSANETTDFRNPPDAYWKHTQRGNQDNTDKSTRRHQSPMPESAVNYYPPENSYKTFKYNAYPYSTHLKHSSILHTEIPQRYQQIITKSSRNNDHTNNVVVNNDRYKAQQEDENNTDYIDEDLGNFTEDNLEEDVQEEADRSPESDKRIGESINKEYDEQEVDDEIDEESDAPVEIQAIQNAVKKNALLRTQRMRMTNQEQDARRVYYAQQSPKLYQAHYLPTRYYGNTPDYDVHETLSEEDLYATQTLRSPPRRSSTGYHQSWIRPRDSTDQYDTMSSPTQPNRRGRTRPEAKSFTEAELADRRTCSRCGNMSTKKLSIPRRNHCRFQDNLNCLTKTRFGDDAEIFDQSRCGHCKHHFERNMGPREIPSPASHSIKSRRSRDIYVPMHETLQEKYPMDEISHEFARMSSRYTKDTPNTLRDKTRHSMQTALGTTRKSNRYND